MASHDDKAAEKLQHEAAKFAKLDEAIIDQVLSDLLTNEKGQKFVWWLLQIGKVGTQPFQLDPHATAFNCGELNVGSQILARCLEVNPQGYVNMQLARKDENERRDEYLARVNSGNDLFAESGDGDG